MLPVSYSYHTHWVRGHVWASHFLFSFCSMGFYSHAFEVTCTDFLVQEGGGKETSLLTEEEPAGRLPVAAWPPPSFCSPPPSLALSSSPSSSSSSAATAAASSLGASWIDEESPHARHVPRHDGPRAIHCVDVLILRYFSYQIWIMHLIFLATLLVSILSPWLHLSLASSGMYRNSLLRLFLVTFLKLDTAFTFCVELNNHFWFCTAGAHHRAYTPPPPPKKLYLI